MIKRGTIGWTIWNIIESLILVAGGLFCVMFANNTDFQAVAFTIAGALVIVDAGLRMLLEVINIFSFNDKTIVKTDFLQAIIGSVELAAGIILIKIGNNPLNAAGLFEFLGIFLGTLLISAGVVVIIHNIIYIAKKIGSVGQNIVSIIGACVLIALGTCSIIYLTKTENLIVVSLILFGLFLMLTGLILFVLTITILVAAKKAKKAINSVIEAEEKANEEKVKAEEAKPEEEAEAK